MPKINPLIFRAYDVRGIAHKPSCDKTPDLTPVTMELIGKACGTYFKRHHGNNIALAHDQRLSAEELTDAFLKGILSTGCDVTVIGMVPTPMLYFAVCHYEFDGGIAITASHNPKEYNGVKVVGPQAHSICGDKLQDIYQLAENGDFETGKGELKELNTFEDYTKRIHEIVKIQARRDTDGNERPLKIVVDAGNGAAGPYVQDFFTSLGCETISLYTEPDGRFPNHPANPEELENMLDLIAAVKEHGADLGIAFDGDADRVGIVDEKGKHYSADWLLMLLSRDLLTRQKGAQIVFDAKVSQLLIDDIKKHGGVPVMQKTGHSFIESKMHEIGSPLGGEISGHMFFAENYYGFDDAFLAGAKLLEILAKSGQNFSELFSDLEETACTPEFKSPCPDTEKFRIVEAITAEMVAQYDCITLDGVRVNFDENSWGAVRCSNTSPNLTLRFEAPTQKRLKEIITLMHIELKKHPEIDLWWAEQFLD
jgi:phosphomannomutase/phosphoglucomutase